MGISSLMGYQNGGGVEDKSEQEILSDPAVQDLIQQMLANQSDGDSTEMQFKQYSSMLNSIAPPRPRASGYDLASSLGAGLLAQQGEKFSSVGRGLGLGFQEFNKLQKEIDAENRKNKQARDMTAFGLVTKKKTQPSAKLGALWRDKDNNFFRELIIGDEIIYKGEGQVLSQIEFGQKFPTARPTVASEEQRYKMNIDDFLKYELEYRTEESSLDKLTDYMKAMGGSKQGFERMAVSVTNTFKTLFGVMDITPEALAQGLAEGKFQGLIGRFRVETVGPGVMTEFDAQRIIEALGAEPGALQNKYRAAAILKDIFESKEKLYQDAAKRYNLGAKQGVYEGYPPVEIRTWDKSIFDFPLSIPEGAELVEEIKNVQDKVVAIVYKENGKLFRRNLDGTVKELKDSAPTPLSKTVPLP